MSKIVDDHRGTLETTYFYRSHDVHVFCRPDLQLMKWREVGYLKKTIAPNIRFRRKEGNKFIKFITDDIKQQIRDVILPESAVDSDI